MTNYELLKALGSLDEKYEAEAKKRADALAKPLTEQPEQTESDEAPRTRKPIYRIMTGVAAAAVFLGVFASVGYVLKNANPNRIQNPGSSALTENSITESSVSENSKTEPAVVTDSNILGGAGKIVVHNSQFMEDDRYYYINGTIRADKTKTNEDGSLMAESICQIPGCNHSQGTVTNIHDYDNCPIAQFLGYKYAVTNQAIHEISDDHHTLYAIDGIGGKEALVSLTQEQVERALPEFENADFFILEAEEIADNQYVIRLGTPMPDEALKNDKPNFLTPYSTDTVCFYDKANNQLIPLYPAELPTAKNSDYYYTDFAEHFAYDSSKGALYCPTIMTSDDGDVREEGAVSYTLDREQGTSEPRSFILSGKYPEESLCSRKTWATVDGKITEVVQVSISDSATYSSGTYKTVYCIDMMQYPDAIQIVDGKIVTVKDADLVIADLNGNVIKTIRWCDDNDNSDYIRWDAEDLSCIVIQPADAYTEGAAVIVNAETGQIIRIADSTYDNYLNAAVNPYIDSADAESLTILFDCYGEEGEAYKVYVNPVLYRNNEPLPVTGKAVYPEAVTVSKEGNNTVTYNWKQAYGQLENGEYEVEFILIPADSDAKPDYQYGCSATQQVFRMQFTVGGAYSDDIPVVNWEVLNTSPNAVALSLHLADAEIDPSEYDVVWDGKLHSDVVLTEKKPASEQIRLRGSLQEDPIGIDWSEVYGEMPDGDYMVRVIIVPRGRGLQPIDKDGYYTDDISYCMTTEISFSIDSSHAAD